MKKRIFSIILCLALSISLLPRAAFAAAEEPETALPMDEITEEALPTDEITEEALPTESVPVEQPDLPAYREGDIAGTTGTGGSQADPVVCDTYEELKRALEDKRIDYVRLDPIPAGSSAGVVDTGGDSDAIVIKDVKTWNRGKHLCLNGEANFTSTDRNTLFVWMVRRWISAETGRSSTNATVRTLAPAWC